MEIGLQNPKYKLFSMQEIEPQGWLLDQLKIQANGLSGNLDKFWPDIKQSKWIGGDCEGWERVPYWLDGFIPLAYLLGNQDMKDRAQNYIEQILLRQKEDGWICPCEDHERNSYDMWAMFLILKVMVVYYDATKDSRVEKFVYNALKNLNKQIDAVTLFGWAKMRWYEVLIAIYWLYERCPEQWLLDLCVKIKSLGFDYAGFLANWPYKMPGQNGIWSQMNHVVNNTMMLKGNALYYLLSNDQYDYDAAERMYELLNEYHGTVAGIINGDECLSGKSPIQGSELCSVAELMYSLEHLISITGNLKWCDRLELIAFNALPATFSPDMWSHQYDQQVNQVQCSKMEKPVFNTNTGDAHIFGLEPNYGCCTANLSQPWPKFALSTFMKAEDGIAILSFAPNKLDTVINGVQTTVELKTMYPFRENIEIQVCTNKEVDFALHIRVPEWADNAYLIENGKKIALRKGMFHIIKKKWQGIEKISLFLPMHMEIKPRANNLVAITRGPLVYSMKIEENWVQINQNITGREYPHCDYEVYPLSAWNYAIADLDITFKEKDFGEMIFSPVGCGISAFVKCRSIDWRLEDGHATELSNSISPTGKETIIEFIPYGCTNLRLTELPLTSCIPDLIVTRPGVRYPCP